jgi:hypothetical protein
MDNRTTFGRLEDLFASLDFREHAQPGCVVFMHDSGLPMIVLPRYRRCEVVEPIHLLNVRKTLMDVGLLEPEEFNLMVQ